jgi:hypothetical protein
MKLGAVSGVYVGLASALTSFLVLALLGQDSYRLFTV